jgi:8-oxo-dGTP pyrophosphatase MutT (NUDIX family)
LDCARRELLEETGLSLDDATFEETVPLKEFMEIHFYRLQE